jgi:hypothetical protein
MFGVLKPRINEINSHKNQLLLVPERQNLLIQTCRFSIPTIFWLSNLVEISRASGTIMDRTLHISFHSSETVCKSSTLSHEASSNSDSKWKMSIEEQVSFLAFDIFGRANVNHLYCGCRKDSNKYSIVHQIVQMPQG